LDLDLDLDFSLKKKEKEEQKKCEIIFMGLCSVLCPEVLKRRIFLWGIVVAVFE